MVIWDRGSSKGSRTRDLNGNGKSILYLTLPLIRSFYSMRVVSQLHLPVDA